VEIFRLNNLIILKIMKILIITGKIPFICRGIGEFLDLAGIFPLIFYCHNQHSPLTELY